MYQRTPAPYWRAERTRRRQKRYDEAGNGRIEYAANHFTGSSGGTVYDASLFPEAFYGNVFTGDVAGNLIHRDVLVPKAGSPTFVAQRAADESDREFLASVDSWFRPASFSVGPDGALYVVDMYRQHIETPLSIPEDLKADMIGSKINQYQILDQLVEGGMGIVYLAEDTRLKRKAAKKNLSNFLKSLIFSI